MKSLNLIVAAFASISSARSVTARQEDVTPAKVCDWFETGRHNSPAELDERCRSDAQKCIDDQAKKSKVFDQVAKDDITLCTFGPRIGNPSTDFLTICSDLDVTPEACHSHTSWCVMDDATFTQGEADKNAALGRVRTCVAGRILNKDGDLDEKRKLVDDCKEEFDRTTPASDILKHTQLGQYCQGQGVECSKCRMYLLDEAKGGKDYLGSYIRVIECQAGAQSGTQSGADTASQTASQTESQAECSATPAADKQPGQSLEEVDRQLKEHCGGPGVNTKDCMFAAHRCTGQVRVDATMEEFLKCVDRMQLAKPW